MSISELTLKSKDDEPVRRFTGSGRRREWSDEQKAQIVAESYEPGVTVCSVARRHGLTSQQLFTWQRLTRRSLDELPDKTPMFAPAIVEPQDIPLPKKVRRASSPRKAHRDAVIELEIGGVTIRIASGRVLRESWTVIPLNPGQQFH
ncbi:IS66-like element accessory protein TnpA [Sinorhizobium meliloti]|uniref:IS66-like element accessory protein TnpA n=1 Tax=Rhizobium meliloti TaxID=382 RepID=UPI0003A10B87|nr:transposase [Sinorhizobium meliloti]